MCLVKGSIKMNTRTDCRNRTFVCTLILKAPAGSAGLGVFLMSVFWF